MIIHDKLHKAYKAFDGTENTSKIEISLYKDIEKTSINQYKQIDHGKQYEMAMLVGIEIDPPFTEDTMLYLYVNDIGNENKQATCFFRTGENIVFFDKLLTYKCFSLWRKDDNSFDILIYCPYELKNNIHFIYGVVPINKRKYLPERINMENFIYKIL